MARWASIEEANKTIGEEGGFMPLLAYITTAEGAVIQAVTEERVEPVIDGATGEPFVYVDRDGEPVLKDGEPVPVTVTIPQNLVNLLLGAVFNLFGAAVVGTRFSLIAVARSDV